MMRRESFGVAVGCLSFAYHLLRVQNWEQDAKGVIAIISIVFVSVDRDFFARVYLQSRSSPWFFFRLLRARLFAIRIITMAFLRSSSRAFICNRHNQHGLSLVFFARVYLQSPQSAWSFFGLLRARLFAIAIITIDFLGHLLAPCLLGRSSWLWASKS